MTTYLPVPQFSAPVVAVDSPPWPVPQTTLQCLFSLLTHSPVPLYRSIVLAANPFPLPAPQAKLQHLSSLLSLPLARTVGLTLRLPVLLTLGQERLADSYRGLSAVLTPLQPPPGRNNILPASSDAALSSYTAATSGVSYTAGVTPAVSQGSASPLQSRPHQKNRLAKAVQELPELLLLAPAKVAEQVRPCTHAHPPHPC